LLLLTKVKELITLCLIGLSVGLSNFAASIAIAIGGVSKSLRLKIIVIFGLFETGMPIVGLIIGHKLSHLLGGNANLIGGGLLGLTGIYTIISALRSADNKEVKLASQSLRKLLLAGFSLSIDNLIVGFGLGTHNEPLLVSALVIGVASVALALFGLEIGGRLGRKLEGNSEVFSGLILIFVGILIGIKII
jgi:putative Mn2+ efflux pump MntP